MRHSSTHSTQPTRSAWAGAIHVGRTGRAEAALAAGRAASTGAPWRESRTLAMQTRRVPTRNIRVSCARRTPCSLVAGGLYAAAPAAQLLTA